MKNNQSDWDKDRTEKKLNKMYKELITLYYILVHALAIAFIIQRLLTIYN